MMMSSGHPGPISIGIPSQPTRPQVNAECIKNKHGVNQPKAGHPVPEECQTSCSVLAPFLHVAEKRLNYHIGSALSGSWHTEDQEINHPG